MVSLLVRRLRRKPNSGERDQEAAAPPTVIKATEKIARGQLDVATDTL
jgi:hypothetical protein